jgi:hypothetical protein
MWFFINFNINTFLWIHFCFFFVNFFSFPHRQTPIGKEELKKINQMITSLLGNSDSFEFRVPVDWKSTTLVFSKKMLIFRDNLRK